VLKKKKKKKPEVKKISQSTSAYKKHIYYDQVGFIPDMQHLKINITQHFNRLKKKNHMIIKTDAQKAFHKLQQPFVILKTYI
jgi:hypothetical protein